MFKKLIASSLAATLAFGVVLPSTTSLAASNKNVQEQVTTTTIATNSEDEVQASGKGGYAVKGALYAIKAGLKAGDWLLDFVLEPLSPSTARYLTSNIGKVSNGIDNAIKKIDDSTYYVQAVVSETLYKGLRAANVPGTYALGIADAIAKVVTFIAM